MKVVRNEHAINMQITRLTFSSMTAEKKVLKSSTGWTEEQEPITRANNRGSIFICSRTHISHSQVSADVQQLLSDLRPQAVGDVHPGAGRALLTPELKGRADGPVHHALHVCRLVNKVKIFATTF